MVDEAGSVVAHEDDVGLEIDRIVPSSSVALPPSVSRKKRALADAVSGELSTKTSAKLTCPQRHPFLNGPSFGAVANNLPSVTR